MSEYCLVSCVRDFIHICATIYRDGGEGKKKKKEESPHLKDNYITT